MKKMYFMILPLIVMGFAGCGGQPAPSISDSNNYETAPVVSENRNKTVDDVSLNEAVWVAYWDNDMAEAYLIDNAENVDVICNFAAYFNEDNSLFIPEGSKEFLDIVKENTVLDDKVRYLTIVNDVNKQSGSSLKDTDLLYNLFKNEKTINKHVDEIISLAIEGNYDGIEIDYERIRNDVKLWNKFVAFEQVLIDKASEKGLSVRIVLEPSTPVDEIQFPAGAEYVMMCYNLYGYGTEPGPKADKDFIISMIEKMDKLPGEKNLAFSNGGFDFLSDNSVKQLTAAEIDSLIENYNAQTIRDEVSGAVHFDYTDNEGLYHQVWYSDEETIQYWKNVAAEYGYDRYTLWRIM